MFVVSDEILERLICSQCKKYLSVKPVKVYPNRGIKCGRCSRGFDAGVISFFGVLAENALFRCVNRFDGCNQLLTYSNVADHEITCTGKYHECPACVTPFKGTGYEILMHFKEQHKDRFLISTAEFVLDADKEQYRSYLFQKNDLLFYVNVSYYKSEKEIIFSVSYLGADPEAARISHMFTLLSVDGKVICKTKKKFCCPKNNDNYFKIAVNKNDFLKNVVICKLDLNTEDVENVLILPSSFKKAGTELSDDKLGNNAMNKNKMTFESSNNSRSVFSSLNPNATEWAPSTGSQHVDFSRSSWLWERTNLESFKFGKSESIPYRFGNREGTNSSFHKSSTTHEKPTGTVVPFRPVVGDDVMCSDVLRNVRTKYYSISVMKEYEKWSFEELRLADYQAGRGASLRCLGFIKPCFTNTDNFNFQSSKWFSDPFGHHERM